MKCIIYGLGDTRKIVEKYMNTNMEILGYSDSFYTQSKFNEKDFFTPWQLKNIKFDVIIIAVSNISSRKKIISNLINIGINESKILDFSSIYLTKYVSDFLLYDNLFSDSKELLNKVNRVIKENCEGLIFGISHAEVGINPKYLSKKFYNLAVSSQDLFYNLRNLQILIHNFSDKIKDLKYVIFDLHKYTYFNYDVSLSKNAIKYYSWSGFRSNDNHNYNRNKNFTRSIEEELIYNYYLEVSHLPENKINLFNEIFCIKNINIVEDYKQLGVYDTFFNDFPEEKVRKNTLSIEDINKFKKNYKPSSIQLNRFDETIEENIKLLDIFFKTIFNINPNIKIYFVLIPQHKVVEDIEKESEHNMKQEFYKIIDHFKKIYNFKLLDFKDYEEISSRNDYYFDIYHLNYKGAEVFTKLLNSYIEY